MKSIVPRLLAAVSLFAAYLLAPALAIGEESVPAPAPQCAAGWESRVYLSARRSVVKISSGDGSAAGFAWKSPRTIVTAMHVVEDGTSFGIVFPDGTKGHARLVAGDRESDVALLELETGPDVPPLELGDLSAIDLGAPVIAIGHPFSGQPDKDEFEHGLHSWTITRGVLSAKNDHRLEIDASLNPGNSGGPIVDCGGRVIGVASYIRGSLGYASASQKILELDQRKRGPGVSFTPSASGSIGAMARVSDFTAYGPIVGADFIFFRRVSVLVRAGALFSFDSETVGDRVTTSRVGPYLYLGTGYSFRPIPRGPSITPLVGATQFSYRENATTFTAGHPQDSSMLLAPLRIAPGISIAWRNVSFDYKLEIDVGRVSDSAHLLSVGYTL